MLAAPVAAWRSGGGERRRLAQVKALPPGLFIFASPCIPDSAGACNEGLSVRSPETLQARQKAVYPPPRPAPPTCPQMHRVLNGILWGVLKGAAKAQAGREGARRAAHTPTRRPPQEAAPSRNILLAQHDGVAPCHAFRPCLAGASVRLFGVVHAFRQTALRGPPGASPMSEFSSKTRLFPHSFLPKPVPRTPGASPTYPPHHLHPQHGRRPPHPCRPCAELFRYPGALCELHGCIQWPGDRLRERRREGLRGELAVLPHSRYAAFLRIPASDRMP